MHVNNMKIPITHTLFLHIDKVIVPEGHGHVGLNVKKLPDCSFEITAVRCARVCVLL
jgi:hypothetical protein